MSKITTGDTSSGWPSHSLALVEPQGESTALPASKSPELGADIDRAKDHLDTNDSRRFQFEFRHLGGSEITPKIPKLGTDQLLHIEDATAAEFQALLTHALMTTEDDIEKVMSPALQAQQAADTAQASPIDAQTLSGHWLSALTRLGGAFAIPDIQEMMEYGPSVSEMFGISPAIATCYAIVFMIDLGGLTEVSNDPRATALDKRKAQAHVAADIGYAFLGPVAALLDLPATALGYFEKLSQRRRTKQKSASEAASKSVGVHT